MTEASSFVLTRYPTNDDELYALVHTLWGVRIPRVQVCPDHCSPFEAFAEAYFGRVPVSVWVGSRGFGGKSRTLAYLTLTEAVVLGAEVNLLGGSFEQSRNIHEAMRDGWDAPLAPRQMVMHHGAQLLRLSNGAKVRPLTASQRTVRGPHPQRLRLDEIDEMDISILDAAMGQPMPKNDIDTQTVMSSTHQYPDGTMTEIIRRAGENNWPVRKWCYLETSNPIDGWLAPQTIERKRTEVSKQMFEIEYNLQEPSVGNRAIDTESVERMFSYDGENTYTQKFRKDIEQYVFEEPDYVGDYVIAADWAKEVDRTVISVWRHDEKPVRLVAFWAGNRMPYPRMIAKFDKWMAEYGARGIHDATGLGGVVADTLEATGKVKGFLMSGRQRDDMLSEYIAAVERDELIAPRVSSAYSAHKYASVESVYGKGKENHLPDEICSFALAWWMVDHGKRIKAKPIIDITKEDGSYWRNSSLSALPRL